MVMKRRMLLAFRRTCIAGVGASTAEHSGEWTTARHNPDRRRTDLGAVAVEPDARGQHCHVVLAEAGVRAHFAGDQTLDARFQTRVVF